MAYPDFTIEDDGKEVPVLITSMVNHPERGPVFETSSITGTISNCAHTHTYVLNFEWPERVNDRMGMRIEFLYKGKVWEHYSTGCFSNH